jgi:hypothetical protein
MMCDPHDFCHLLFPPQWDNARRTAVAIASGRVPCPAGCGGWVRPGVDPRKVLGLPEV